MTTGLGGEQAYNISTRYIILYKMKEGYLDWSYLAHKPTKRVVIVNVLVL